MQLKVHSAIHINYCVGVVLVCIFVMFTGRWVKWNYQLSVIINTIVIIIIIKVLKLSSER